MDGDQILRDAQRVIDGKRAAMDAPREVRALGEPLNRLVNRVAASLPPPEPPAMPTPEELARGRENRVADLVADAGRRYTAATLANYEVFCQCQAEVVNALRSYACHFDRERSGGNGILLFGPSGTGKDHLLLGAARLAILKHGCTVRWRNGVDLYAEWRDMIDSGSSEADRVRHYARPDVLILSDPLPPVDAITGFQAQVLLAIIDRRYRDLRPTWCSMNVENGDEARQRMGTAVIDRLSHGTLVRYCNWPSYRAGKARKQP